MKCSRKKEALEIETRKYPVKECIKGHREHQGAKHSIAFHKVYHIGGPAVLKCMIIQILKVFQYSHTVSLWIKAKLAGIKDRKVYLGIPRYKKRNCAPPGYAYIRSKLNIYRWLHASNCRNFLQSTTTSKKACELGQGVDREIPKDPKPGIEVLRKAIDMGSYNKSGLMSSTLSAM